MQTSRYVHHDSCKFCYRAFGLTIGTSLELPELIPAAGEPDVVIQQGRVPGALKNPKKTGVRFQAKPGNFLLTVDRVARFQVLQGNRIIVDAYPGVQAKDVRVFLLGSAFGALFHQRGMFPLHGSAVKVHEQCVVFCGASGRGKSTTAKALVNRGYALHADDICPVSVAHLGNGGTPVVFPAYPQMKLWQDALDKIGEDPSGYGRVRHVLDKYEVPAADRFNTQPLPLRKIYVLRPWEQEGINISEITGRYKFTALKNQTYRFGFLEGLGQQVSHLNHAGIIGSRVPVFSVQRPRLQFRLDELIDALEADFVP